MKSGTGRRTVGGIFENEGAAAKAVEMLVKERFSPAADLSVVVSHDRERKNVPIEAEPPVVRVAATGAAIGAVLAGAAAAVAGLAFGPFTLIAAGPLYAVLESAYIGAALGTSMGVLLCHDFAKPKVAFDDAHIDDAVVWIGVRAEESRAERAREILSEAGARRLMDGEPELVGV